MRSAFEKYNDEQLIELIRGNDPDAMEFLIKKYSPLVKKCTRTLFLIGADSEDLSQEGMIGLFKAIQNYDISGKASFFTYARLCINSQVSSAIKASNRQKHIPLNSYISLYSNINEGNDELIELLEAGKNSNPEHIILDKEETTSINSWIDGNLSKLEKKVLSYYLQGLSTDDISVKLSKPKKSIENAIARIRKKIRESNL